MFGIRTRRLAAVVVATLSSPMALMAQWGMPSDCSCSSPQQYVAAPAPVVTTACQCLQPVTHMVAHQVQVTEHQQVQRIEKRPVTRMRTVSKQVTAYRQEMENKVVEVPAVTYQTVTEMQDRTINKSRWQTVSQPVPKMSSCQYDNRPGFTGSMNRMGYSMRTAFQPNFVTHRQFIPQVCQCKVPVQRQVAVQTTRQMTVSTAKMVPYQTTQQVAEAYTDYEDVTVTTMVPHTVTKTVHVPTTRYALVDPNTGMAVAPQETQTAKEPTPATRAAENNSAPTNGTYKGTAIPKPATNRAVTTRRSIDNDAATQPVTNRTPPTVASSETGGWKAHTPTASQLSAAKNSATKNSVAAK